MQEAQTRLLEVEQELSVVQRERDEAQEVALVLQSSVELLTQVRTHSLAARGPAPLVRPVTELLLLNVGYSRSSWTRNTARSCCRAAKSRRLSLPPRFGDTD